MIRDTHARISRQAELETAVREYLAEYDTPAKDYVYRARLRERLRELIDPSATADRPSTGEGVTS